MAAGVDVLAEDDDLAAAEEHLHLLAFFGFGGGPGFADDVDLTEEAPELDGDAKADLETIDGGGAANDPGFAVVGVTALGDAVLDGAAAVEIKDDQAIGIGAGAGADAADDAIESGDLLGGEGGGGPALQATACGWIDWCLAAIALANGAAGKEGQAFELG